MIRRESTPVPCGPPSKPDLVWIEPGFALGSRPYAHQRKAVSQLGIRVVVALHETNEHESEAWQAYGVRLVPVPTPDWVDIPIWARVRECCLLFGCFVPVAWG